MKTEAVSAFDSAGVFIDDFSAKQGELEVLFPPATEFEIVEIVPKVVDGETITRVVMKEI